MSSQELLSLELELDYFVTNGNCISERNGFQIRSVRMQKLTTAMFWKQLDNNVCTITVIFKTITDIHSCVQYEDSIVLQISISMRISRFLLIILIVSLSGTGLLFYISYSKNTSFSLLQVTSTIKQGIYCIVHVSVFLI